MFWVIQFLCEMLRYCVRASVTEAWFVAHGSYHWQIWDYSAVINCSLLLLVLFMVRMMFWSYQISQNIGRSLSWGSKNAKVKVIKIILLLFGLLHKIVTSYLHMLSPRACIWCQAVQKTSRTQHLHSWRSIQTLMGERSLIHFGI